MTLNWNIGLEDSGIIRAIVDRAHSIQPTLNRGLLNMDLTAVHLNGTPLDLVGLLSAERFDFIHDIAGIDRHIDRASGRLTDCFVPRYAARNSTPASA